MEPPTKWLYCHCSPSGGLVQHSLVPPSRLKHSPGFTWTFSKAKVITTVTKPCPPPLPHAHLSSPMPSLTFLSPSGGAELSPHGLCICCSYCLNLLLLNELSPSPSFTASGKPSLTFLLPRLVPAHLPQIPRGYAL